MEHEIQFVKKSSSSHIFRFCLPAAAFVCIALSAASLYLVLRQPKLMTQSSSLSKETCISCHQLETTLYDDESTNPLLASLTVKEESGTKLCCACDLEQLIAMIKLISKRQQSLTYYRGSSMSQSKHSTPFAHKLLKYNQKYQPHSSGKDFSLPRGGQILAINKTNDPRYELAQGVGLMPEGIKILRSGLYYVYQSVRVSNSICKRNYQLTFTSDMVCYCKASGAKTKVLSSQHTCCQDCETDTESLFTAGQFYFHAEDVLKIKVSSINMVNFAEKESYLGLYFIGDMKNQNK